MPDTDNRGFASMDDEQKRKIASEGGKAAHTKGTAHEFDTEEARKAGRKGGETVSQDAQHMADIGRKGGESGHDSGGTKGGSTRGGSHEQHVKAGEQSHKKP